MNDKDISVSFINVILPILRNYQKDGHSVLLHKSSISVMDGSIPAKISIDGACFAYTLGLKDAIRENFDDVGIYVIHGKPSNVTDWVPLNSFV